MALLFSVPAFAADLPSHRHPYRSPTRVGLASTSVSMRCRVGGDLVRIDQRSERLLASGSFPGGAALGAVGGIQAGYNWQFAPVWVVGVEGDFSWASLSDQRGGPGVRAKWSTGWPAGTNANTQWLASARAKLGFTGWFNNTMLYITGGGAWANIEYNATFVTTPPLNLAAPSQTTTKSGWVIGGGAEWMATPNILLRAEYLYYGIDSSNNLSAVAFPIAAPLPVAVNWGKENIQVFRVAGSYKF